MRFSHSSILPTSSPKASVSNFYKSIPVTFVARAGNDLCERLFKPDNMKQGALFKTDPLLRG